GHHVLAIINDILTLAKIEAGRLEWTPITFEVGAVVRGVASTVAPQMEQNHNHFVIICPNEVGLIHTDLARLRQVLLDLLSNATKFTSEGEIVLEVGHEREQRKAWLCFSVTDSGIGIPPEKLQEIFKPFSQVDATMTRRYGGTGL
nr:ATPase [Ardenticatenales bacterium]